MACSLVGCFGVLLLLAIAFPENNAREAIIQRELSSLEGILSSAEREKLGKLDVDDNTSYNEAFKKIFELVKTKDAATKEKFAQAQEAIWNEKVRKAAEFTALAENLKPLLSKKGIGSFAEMIKIFRNQDLRPSDIRLQLQGLFDTLEDKDKAVLGTFFKQNLMQS